MDNTKLYCKVGRVELTEAEAWKIYNEKKYICTSTAIYQGFYSKAQNQVYFVKIADYKGIARRGRYYTLTADHINRIMGYEFLHTEIY